MNCFKKLTVIDKSSVISQQWLQMKKKVMVVPVQKKTITITGINHGIVLQHFLLMDGWKKEKFTDVTFFCRSLYVDLVQGSIQKNKLHANRSVLAAASEFFADLLPNDELELDICVSVELTFEEMSCVLEYIYSGKFQCLLQNKERVLGILKDFGIFVPEHALMQSSKLIPTSKIVQNERSVENIENRRTETVNCTNSVDSTIVRTPLIKTNGPNNAFISKISNNMKQTTIQLDKNKHLLHENKRSKDLNTKNRNFPVTKYQPLRPKPVVNISNNPTKSPALGHSDPLSSKSPVLLLMKSTSNILKTPRIEKIIPTNISNNQCVFNHPTSETRSNNKNKEIDDLLLQNVPNKEAVTLQLPRSIPSNSTLFQQNSHTTDPLYTSWSETCYGIYSPSEPDICQSVELDEPHRSLATPKEQSLVYDPPTLLKSRPRRVYNRLKDSPLSKRKQKVPRFIVKHSDIQNIKQCNGKIHIVLNPPSNPTVNQSTSLPVSPPVNSPVYSIQLEPFLEQEVILIEKPSSKKTISDEETLEDKDDFILAQNFLKAERKRKKLLQKRIGWMIRRFTQLKCIAHSILEKTREQRKKDAAAAASESQIPVKPRVRRRKITKEASKPPAKKQCYLCGKMIANLTNHLKIHSGLKPHVCDLCGRSFPLKSYLRAHKRRNHSLEKKLLKTFSCSVCDYTIRCKKQLEVHERTHTGERPFECQYCDKNYRSKELLKRHLRTHTGEKPYACKICGKSYGAKESYLCHFTMKHETNPDKIPRRFLRKMKTVKRCEICQKTFRRILDFEKHRATHTGEVPSVRCAIRDCDFSYSESSQLKDHIAVCHPEKIFTCTICSKIFLNKTHLNVHQVVHDIALGFLCSYCPKRCSTKGNLAVHERIHTRDTPYGCSECEMRFHSTHMLNLHIRKKHELTQSKKRNRTKSMPAKKQE